MRKKLTRKKLARLEAKTTIRRGMLLDGFPKDGMIIPVVTFDLENNAVAERSLIAAGYCGAQASMLVTNTIRTLITRAQKKFDEK